MLKIGLTGGIGCGKSTVAKYFAKLKIPVIDADKIAHELLRPGTTAYKKTLTHFGKTFLTSKKTIDRKKLRQKIFSNHKERTWLENLLHPLIRTNMKKQTAKLKTSYCIMVIPLLFETKFPIRVDRILLIDCTQKTQIERIRKRDNSSIKQAQAMIKSQIKRQSRLKRADDLICNSGSLADLKKEVKKLHRYYLKLI